jgi:Phosphodiester glycosidase
MAEILIQQNARYVINVDGGSSSTLVQGTKNSIINRPTCLDILPFVCERPVATVLCLQLKEEI